MGPPIAHDAGAVRELVVALGTAMLAAGDSVDAVSSPHTTIDPVVMAASTVMKLQTIVSRGTDPGATGVVTVGALQAGTKENIIPDTATLSLSVRTFEPAVRDRVLATTEMFVLPFPVADIDAKRARLGDDCFYGGPAGARRADSPSREPRQPAIVHARGVRDHVGAWVRGEADGRARCHRTRRCSCSSVARW